MSAQKTNLNKTRQKKQQQKNIKRKQKLKSRAQEIKSPQDKQLFAIQAVQKTLNYPILDCVVTPELLETGIGFAIFSRNLPDNLIAVCVFRLFLDENGVQEALFSKMSQTQYQDLKTHIRGQFYNFFGKRTKYFKYEKGLSVLDPIEPSILKNLILAAVEFAASKNHHPPEQYPIAMAAFENLPEPTTCPIEPFRFGHYRETFLEKQKQFEAQEQSNLDQKHTAAIKPLRAHFLSLNR